MESSALSRASKVGITQYNPHKGLKTVAVAEAAEKHYARAKDATNLQKAIRAKLEAQAEFVFWWDTQAAKAQGQRTDKLRRGSATKSQAGRDGLPERYVIDRWRRKLNDPDKFETAYALAVSRYGKILEFDQTVHVNHNSGDNEWYTPAEYVEAARSVLGGIDLDPATTPAANALVQAAQIFTRDESGLDQPWHGRVWMNPPYSQPLIEHFCEKFAGHAERGEITGIVLVNNATETTWFQRLASATMCFCFPQGRIRFWSPEKVSATPLQGQVVCYTGADTATFSQAFRRFGFIAERTA